MQDTQGTQPFRHADSPYLVEQPLPWNAGHRAATVLMATDGTERSDGALLIAAARASSAGATLELMTVIHADAILAAEDKYFGEAESLRRWTTRRMEIERQTARVLGAAAIHSITVFDGNPAYTISRVAIERRASLIVVGIGRHLLSQRLLNDEIALQLARIARVPVLAVPTNVAAALRHAVVAIDFSEISTRAAQSAIDAISDEGHVELVHVIPQVRDDAAAGEAQATYEQWANEQFIPLTAQLVVPAGVTVTCTSLKGRPASELLAYATRVGADLIATGTHGRGFVARTILGSVTTTLLRGATCSLLTVPRDPLPALAPSQQDTAAGESFESPMAWSRLLTEFTKRNTGRRTMLEVDDLEIGAQAQAYNYPLVSASYSARDGRLDLIVGDRRGDGRQVARAMGSVLAVDVLTDGAGHDVSLRIQTGAGQTLLTFAA